MFVFVRSVGGVRFLVAGFVLSFVSVVLAGGQGHSHGQASAEVSLQGKVLRVEIHGAMDNFLSFEHAPKTEAQRVELGALRSRLKDAAWLLLPSDQAQCRVSSIRSESALFDLTKPVKGHADLHVDLSFECANPAALTSIRFTSLDRGRRMKKLAVEFVGPTGQRAVTLTQAKPVLEIK